MFNINPAMKAAISKVCNDPATKIVSVLPDLNREQVQHYLERIFDFLRDSFEDLKEVEYLLRVGFSSSTPDFRKKLDTPFISQTLRASANTFFIDADFNVLGIDDRDTSASAISEYSFQEKCCVIHILNGVDFIIYANGLTIKEMNIRSPLQGPMTRKRYARSAHDYKLSIIEHYQNRVRFSQFCDHWADKNERLLRAERQTEMIFHSNLQNWLEEHLEYATVYGRVKKVTGNETDIEIRTLGGRGRFYIIEVKWLGKNASKTTYTQDDLARAFKQVKNYLDSEKDVLEACLVAYDGRSLEDFRKLEHCGGELDQWKKVQRCQSEELPPRGTGLVFFLESRSASQTR